MRQLWIGILGLALVAGLAAMALTERGRRPAWSTDSEAALEAFERGLTADIRYYRAEAREEFERAVALDPSFAAARVRLLHHTGDKERRQELVDGLRATDLDALTPRERFLVEYALAREAGEPDAARQILESYLEEQPECSFALAMGADTAWESEDSERAREYYERLLEADPNWVSAQNRLGYLAMAEGRFEDAEEQFRTYSYVAPDQANPHDSLGEMLTLVGRYEEARAELNRALEIKEDFCPAHQHLVDLAILQGRPEEAETLLDATRGCSDSYVEQMRCHTKFWADFLAGDFGSPWTPERAECLALIGQGDFLIHRMAALSSRLEFAQNVERDIRNQIEEMEARTGTQMTMPRAVLLHMEGVRLAVTGDYRTAAAHFDRADESLRYWGQGAGILKLFNRLNLAFALGQAGYSDEQREVIESVRAVNPRFAEAYRDIELSFLSAVGVS